MLNKSVSAANIMIYKMVHLQCNSIRPKAHKCQARCYDHFDQYNGQSVESLRGFRNQTAQETAHEIN